MLLNATVALDKKILLHLQELTPVEGRRWTIFSSLQALNDAASASSTIARDMTSLTSSFVVDVRSGLRR